MDAPLAAGMHRYIMNRGKEGAQSEITGERECTGAS